MKRTLDFSDTINREYMSYTETLLSTVLTSALMAAGLVVAAAGVQLFRFLSPNTGRGCLRRPDRSYRKKGGDIIELKAKHWK